MLELTPLLIDSIKSVLTGGRRIRGIFLTGFAMIFAAIVLAASAEFRDPQIKWSKELGSILINRVLLGISHELN